MGICGSKKEDTKVEVPKQETSQYQTENEETEVCVNSQVETVPEKEDYLEKLRKNSFSSLKDFTFDGKIACCKVKNFYDGDTCTLIFYDAGRPVKYHFRMYGFDSPEMKPLKTTPNRDLHIKAAHIARDILSNKIKEKDNLVWIKFTKEEKFGRLMGWMFLSDSYSEFNEANSLNLNQWMIDNGLGKSYQGKKKEEFTLKELQDIIKMDS